MAYTTIDQIRNLTNGKLTSSLVSDAMLTEIILQATAKINSLINVKVREEEVDYIDNVRENEIHDGVTTKFYVKNGITNYLADVNNDGTVTTSDVRVYKVDNEDVRTELTVSAIDVEDGSFTLSAVPGTDTSSMFVWYDFSFYNVNTPDKLVELMATYLSTSYAYLRKDHSLPSSTKFGNISISRAQQSTSYMRYWNGYMDLLKQITIPLNKPKVGTYKSQI